VVNLSLIIALRFEGAAHDDKTYVAKAFLDQTGRFDEARVPFAWIQIAYGAYHRAGVVRSQVRSHGLSYPRRYPISAEPLRIDSGVDNVGLLPYRFAGTQTSAACGEALNDDSVCKPPHKYQQDVPYYGRGMRVV